jgi:peptidoglycan/LPS O-acetylase OafA/YrhL
MKMATDLAPEESVFSVFFMIYVALSIAAALLLHYLVEKPFLIVKDRVRD